MKTLSKINNYLENTGLNLYWVITLALIIAGEVILLDYFLPSENPILTGISFLIWALNIYIWRKLLSNYKNSGKTSHNNNTNKEVKK